MATSELRPGYTLAELCSTGAESGLHGCQAGSYDGTFIPSAAGKADPPASGSGYTIAGRVLTVEGTALAGLAIVAAVERLTGQAGEAPGTLRFWTVTDSLGRYALNGLPDGEYTVRSQGYGAYPSARISARAGVDYANLVVSPNVALVAEGKVVTAAGEPLAGVTVLPAVSGQPSVQTGNDGRFSLPVQLKPTIKTFALRFQLPGYHEQSGRLEIPHEGAAHDVALQVVMYPVEAWTSVQGTVSADSGQPLAGRTVELRPRAEPRVYQATTDARGQYEFPVVESPADYRLVVLGGAGHKDYQRDVRVTADMDALDAVVETYAFGAVSGQLVNVDGEPVPDFELVLRNAGSRAPNALVSTDEDGNFDLPAVPAGALVVASQSTPAILVEGIELQSGEQLHLPLVLDWGAHEIRGVVVDARGRPVPASRIVMQWAHRADGITTRTTRRTAADAEGRFAFSQLGPGPHDLHINAPGLATVVVNHDVGRQGQDLTVRLN